MLRGLTATVSGIGYRGRQFAILTASRTGEVLGAEWREFELEARTWTIPAERMKAGKEYRVPLSGAAMRSLSNCAAPARM